MTLRSILAVSILVLAAGCAAIPAPLDGPSPTADPAGAGGIEVTVERVVDGDTMDIRYSNGTTERVRLLGVDTPETHTGVSPDEWEGVPDSQAGRQCLQTWGDRATQYAIQELAGKTVTLVIDPESDTRGGYGRLLGYLAYDDSTFNRRLLETGYARMYDSQFSLRDTYAAIERSAMENETGAWTCRTPSTPESGDTGSDGGDESSDDSSGTVDVALSIAVHADADGHDGENLNDEYVTITNEGSSDLDISGWTVSDAAGHTYEFRDRTLDAGASVTLHTGSGTDTATDVYWGASSPIWNNDGDTVTIRNEPGAMAAQTSY